MIFSLLWFEKIFRSLFLLPWLKPICPVFVFLGISQFSPFPLSLSLSLSLSRRYLLQRRCRAKAKSSRARRALLLLLLPPLLPKRDRNRSFPIRTDFFVAAKVVRQTPRRRNFSNFFISLFDPAVFFSFPKTIPAFSRTRGCEGEKNRDLSKNKK